jgi:hypothetical protein
MVAEGRVGMKAKHGLWDWTTEAVAAEKAAIEKRLQEGMAILRESPDPSS